MFKDEESIQFHIDMQLQWHKHKTEITVHVWCPEGEFPDEALLQKVQCIYLQKGWGHVSWKYYPLRWWEKITFSERPTNFIFTLKQAKERPRKLERWYTAITCYLTRKNVV